MRIDTSCFKAVIKGHKLQGDRVVIERAIASQKNHLPPDTAIEEEKGRCLLIICQKVLGEFKDVGTQNGTKDENHSEA